MTATSNFKCPICASPYFSAIFEKNQHVGRYCKGWPTGYDRSYHPCKGKHEERFGKEAEAGDSTKQEPTR